MWKPSTPCRASSLETVSLLTSSHFLSACVKCVARSAMLLASGVVLQSKATWLSSSLRPRLQSLRMPCEKSWWHGISWKIASSMKCYILATSYKLQQTHFRPQPPRSQFHRHDLRDYQFRFHRYLGRLLDYHHRLVLLDRFMEVLNLVVVWGKCCRIYPHQRCRSSPSAFLFVSFRTPCYCSKILVTPNREYPRHKIASTIQAISRFEDGNVQSITTLSQDGLAEFLHSVDPVTTAAVETSMAPFLDNGHIDRAHKYRVQFQGAHNLKIAKFKDKGCRESIVLPNTPLVKERGKRSSVTEPDLTDFLYPDFLEFQSLLLQNKEVKYCIDFNVMKCTRGNVQSRLGNIRTLLDPDPIYRMRSILYFRKTNDQKSGFVERPGKLS